VRQAFDVPPRGWARCHLAEVHDHPIPALYEMDFALMRVRHELVALLKGILVRLEVQLNILELEHIQS
jgi:hypothetical protein